VAGYRRRLAAIPDVVPLAAPANSTGAHHLFVILVPAGRRRAVESIGTSTYEVATRYRSPSTALERGCPKYLQRFSTCEGGTRRHSDLRER
jgi:hypothetical protein